MQYKTFAEEWLENNQGLIKIKKLFSMGYLPSRGQQSYFPICKHSELPYAYQVNCFAHACLNLTNKQLEKLKLEQKDAEIFDIKTHSYETEEETEESFIKRIQAFGLTAQPCAKDYTPEKENQWKVALYFGFSCHSLDFDYHFLRQEKDGSWTSKTGWSCDDIDVLSSLPETYHAPSGTEYQLKRTYIITNPHAKKSLEKKEINPLTLSI